MNFELLEALEMLEKEKNISRETLIDAISTSLVTACRTIYGKNANVNVDIDPETCEYSVSVVKTVVEEPSDPNIEISLTEARAHDPKYEIGDAYSISVNDREYGRIAAQNAKNVILQAIREEERKGIIAHYTALKNDVVTGVVQRQIGRNLCINLGRIDAILTEGEMIKDEVLKPNDRVKVLILDVIDKEKEQDRQGRQGRGSSKNPKILVSRANRVLVKRLFESEVTEVRDGTVEIKGIAREAGSRTKMAVWSNNPDVDPVGACVGMNGSRVNAVVRELKGEKIDVVCWNENPAILIENALSPAKVVAVLADPDEKSAKVIVPDYQLSLAIGKGGQNARLAAMLTGFKIDIKSETDAGNIEDWLGTDDEYDEYEDYDEYMEARENDDMYDDYEDDYEDVDVEADTYPAGDDGDGFEE